jgi:hypothetical protein
VGNGPGLLAFRTLLVEPCAKWLDFVHDLPISIICDWVGVHKRFAIFFFFERKAKDLP